MVVAETVKVQKYKKTRTFSYVLILLIYFKVTNFRVYYKIILFFQEKSPISWD